MIQVITLNTISSKKTKEDVDGGKLSGKAQ